MFLNRKTSELNKTDLYSKILELKNSMNVNRVSYVLPAGHNIRITGNYLVGLLEGDGSFYFNKQGMSNHSLFKSFNFYSRLSISLRYGYIKYTKITYYLLHEIHLGSVFHGWDPFWL